MLLAWFQVEAHVSLLNPIGGEVFSPGDMVTLEWQEVVSHNTLDWDLYFSIDGGLTWDIIKMDIPLGTLSYQWVVPKVQTTEGQIRVVQDNVGGDYDDKSGYFTISSVTGADPQFEINKINLFPNPLTSFSTLTFENSNNNTYTLEMYDIQGQLVRTIADITTDEITIQRNNLPGGLYFLQLHSDQELSAIGRLIVE